MKDLSLDKAVEFLYDQISYVTVSFVPLRRARSAKSPCWFSVKLISLIRAKKAAHRDYKRHNNHHDYLTFCHLRSACKLVSAACHKNYIAHTEECIPRNIKAFWKFVNRKRVTGGLPNSMHFSGSDTSCGSQMAEMFADYFESVYSAPNVDYPV